MEATIVCVDNSEWTRNGDYTPDRFQAQTAAVNLLAESKLQGNPENGVGILTMAGKSPQVLVTPTTDMGKILGCLSSLNIAGEHTNICTSVQIAQLALKHRPNKNQRQRIVLFSGSPVIEDQAALLSIAKKLKKNNVAMDIVCFGSGEESVEKLQSFMNAVQNSDNCHFVNVQQGFNISDALIGTPIFVGENSSFGAGAMGGDGDYADPNIDPELALALRVSMEEERERQSRAAAAQAGEGSSTQATDAPADAQPTEQGSSTVDENLIQDIAASMREVEAEEGRHLGDAIEDAELQAALRMSMETLHGSSDSIINSELVNSVLRSLPGVDPDNPDIRSIVENLGKMNETGEKKEEEKKDDADKDEQPPSSSS